MFSIDISRAYRNFPLDPLDWPLMAIKSKIHIDLAMPFGARSSSLNMQLVAQYILRHLHGMGIEALIYLDDLVGYATTREAAMQSPVQPSRRRHASSGSPLGH